MRSNYKRIGDYIKQIKAKNTDGKYRLLLGINIDKHFMPSVANIVGVDLKKYKVVKQNQFACNRMHVGRDYRIPIALSDQETPFIVSPAYTVFKIKDTSKLLPGYLMMWFSRPEFDREAWFHTDADVRGGLPWDLFCDIELPIPSIEKQQEIVAEYNTISNRIALNEQLNHKLEETAQALYKHWFVDFEFPNEDGKPYKSSGGEMVWCDELDMEIPVGWEVEELMNFCKITSSKRIFEREYTEYGVPFYRAGEIRLKKEGKPIQDVLYISEDRYNEIVEKFGQPQEGDILMTAVGSLLGDSYLVKQEKFYFKDGNVIWLKDFSYSYSNILVFTFLQSKVFEDFLDEIRIGSGQSAITIQGLGDKKFIIPSKVIRERFNSLIEPIYKRVFLNTSQNQCYYNLSDLLLSKMTKVEDKKEIII